MLFILLYVNTLKITTILFSNKYFTSFLYRTHVNRVVGAVEAIDWLRDKKTSGIQKIAYGKWIVTKKVTLIAVVGDTSFSGSTKFYSNLLEGLDTFLEESSEKKR